MPEYAIVPATMAHAEELAANMRKADVAEIWAAGRHKPLEALKLSLVVSRDPKAGLVDGRVVCMFGIAAPTLMSFTGVPWLLGSEELARHWRYFLRANIPVVARMREEYDVLANYVDARNKTAIRWLKWLGFDIKEAQPYGPDGLPFHRFEMKA